MRNIIEIASDGSFLLIVVWDDENFVVFCILDCIFRKSFVVNRISGTDWILSSRGRLNAINISREIKDIILKNFSYFSLCPV